MYNFMTVVHDVVKHSSQIVTMVQVIDVPSMPPQWTKPFSTARFLEKQAQVRRKRLSINDEDVLYNTNFVTLFAEFQSGCCRWGHRIEQSDLV